MKHPRFEVLKDHPNRKFPEFPWSLYELMIGFDSTDGKDELDTTNETDEKEESLIYFDKQDRDMLVDLCPDLAPHFASHRMSSYLPFQ